MVNDWERLLLLIRRQLDNVNLPVLLAGWAVIAAAAALCFHFQTSNSGRKRRRSIVGLLLYSWFIIGMTLLRNCPEEKEAVNLTVNLGSILFWEKGGRRQMVYSLLNFLLFVPWGYRMEKLQRSGRILRSAACGFLFSLGIEILQLIFRVGVFELNDLITNTAGTLAGAVLCGCFRRDRKG